MHGGYRKTVNREKTKLIIKLYLKGYSIKHISYETELAPNTCLRIGRNYVENKLRRRKVRFRKIWDELP